MAASVTTSPTTIVPGASSSASGTGRVPELVERARPGVGPRRPRGEQHGGGCRGGPAPLEQVGRDRGPRAEAHQHDDGRGVRGKAAEQRLPGRLGVAGHDREGRGEAAVRHRDPGERGSGERRADARHDLVGDARRPQRQDLLASAAEDEGISALEAHDALAAARRADHQRVDRLLAEGGATRALAHGEALGPGSEGQHLRRDEGVVEDEVGRGERAHGAHGEQLRVAGAGADDRDVAGHARASSGA